MEAQEPVQKRLRRIAEHLDELMRVDMVKSLGEHGLENVVFQILQYLEIGEIWEVISHNLKLRQWLHRRGVWRRLAEMRIKKENLDAFMARLLLLSSVTNVNYFWYLCVAQGYAVRTASGIIVRKWWAKSKNERFASENKLSFKASRMDGDLFSTFIQAFPGLGYKIEMEPETETNYDEVTIKLSDKTEGVFATDATVKAAQDVFLYMILARGGSVLVFVGNPEWSTEEDELDYYLRSGDTEPFYSIHFIRSELKPNLSL
jgi:hypothetical protein